MPWRIMLMFCAAACVTTSEVVKITANYVPADKGEPYIEIVLEGTAPSAPFLIDAQLIIPLRFMFFNKSGESMRIISEQPNSRVLSPDRFIPLYPNLKLIRRLYFGGKTEMMNYAIGGTLAGNPSAIASSIVLGQIPTVSEVGKVKVLYGDQDDARVATYAIVPSEVYRKILLEQHEVVVDISNP